MARMLDAPACPRCGYDQSGVIAMWSERCPLAGVCSECGLPIVWRDVLNPEWATPRWSFEHHRGWWQVGKHIRTCWAALRPWSFWRRLAINLPIRRSRLLRHAAAMLVGCHLLMGLVSAGWAGLHPWRWMMTPAGVARPLTPAEVHELQFRCALDAFIWPYGQARMSSPAGSWSHRIDVPGWIVFAIVWALLTPPAFFALTDSMKGVPVRRQHLLRGLAYGLTPLPLVVAAWYLAQTDPAAVLVRRWSRALFGQPLQNVLEVAAPSLFLALGLWQCVYWSMFTRRYLRIPHPEGVAAAMLTIGGLSAAIGVLLIRVFAASFQIEWPA